MDFFTIKDLENLSGIKAHTIRMWEQRYDFLKPGRTESNIRHYDGKELKKLLNIALLNKAGFRISLINRMSEEEMSKKILALTLPFAQEQNILTELLASMMELNTARFDQLLEKHICEKGFSKSVQYVVFPFLEKIGLLWTTGHMTVAQEHAAVSVIRQKFIVAIENTRSRIRRNVNFMLFLPEGEFHELGLLYVWFLLRSRGIPVLYLGANMPIGEAASACSSAEIDYVYLHLTSVTGNFQWDQFLHSLQTAFQPRRVVISGPMAFPANPESLPDNISFKFTIHDVVSFLNAC